MDPIPPKGAASLNRSASAPAESVSNALTRLLAGPADPKAPFALPGRTYGDLYRLAEEIRQQATGTTAPLCLCTEDKTLIAAALLAALAGGFSLVLPHGGSASALTEIREQVAISRVITGHPRELPPETPLLIPKGDAPPLSKEAPATDPDVPFLTFFTGGSTGRPKMWSKTPRNILAEALFHVQRYNIIPADRILATISPLHIYGFLYTVLIPLVASAGVVAESSTFPEEIRTALTTFSPTLFVSVPVHYRVLNTTPIPGASLRHAVSSAGRLDEADGACFHRTTGIGVTEIYGSTETGGIADRCRARGEAALQPFGIVAWRVREERLQVRSPFISPEIDTDADGFFTTGDRVAARADGTFTLLGRADGIVKIGGNRVDTEAVRDALKGVDGVEDAVVFHMPGEGGRENDLHAVAQGRMDPARLRALLGERLAPHAIPRRIRVVDRIPVSASGKYEKQRLLALFGNP